MSDRGEPPFRIRFKASAWREFKALDGSLKPLVAAQLKKIQENPLAGEPLGNKMGIDLTGYRKIYVAKKKIRVVWQVVHDRAVVVVIGIGRRDKGAIYTTVVRRLMERESTE